MWMVNYGVCGYLWRLHIVSFFPQKQVTFSADLTWLSARDIRVLQIYPSGGFRPVFLFVLGFLACCIFSFVFFFFLCCSLHFYFFFNTKQILCFVFFFKLFLFGSVVNHLLVLLLCLEYNKLRTSSISWNVSDSSGIWPLASTNTSEYY